MLKNQTPNLTWLLWNIYFFPYSTKMVINKKKYEGENKKKPKKQRGTWNDHKKTSQSI